MNMFDDASLPQIDAVISALGMGLLHSLWQCALIGALAWLALRTLRHASPQARYVVSCAALAACVLWPAAAVLRQLSTATAPTFDMSATVSSQRDMASMFAAFVAPDRPADLRSILEAALPWLVAIWAAGACQMLLRLAGGLRWVHRLEGDTLNVEDHLENQAWQTRLDRLAQRFGLSACRPVGLSACRPVGLSACRPVGLSGCRACGLRLAACGLRLAVFDDTGGPLSTRLLASDGAGAGVAADAHACGHAGSVARPRTRAHPPWARRWKCSARNRNARWTASTGRSATRAIAR